MVEKVGEGIYAIDTLALGFEKTVAAYLIKDKKIALVDNGYASSFDLLLREIAAAGVSPSDIDYIIPTHVHLDHAGATGHLVRASRKGLVLAHERAARHLADPSKLIASVKSVYGEVVLNLFGEPLPVPQERIRVVGDGEGLSTGSHELAFIYAPGHAPHQLVVYDSTTASLFSADALGILYPNFPYLIPTTPPPSFNLELAVATIGKLAGLNAKALLTPHFGRLEASQEYFELNKERMTSWARVAEEVMRNQGGPREIFSALAEFLERESNVPKERLPEYALGSLTISSLGLYSYLTGKR